MKREHRRIIDGYIRTIAVGLRLGFTSAVVALVVGAAITLVVEAWL